MSVTETHVQKALDYLRDSAQEAAEARAERVYCEEYRKSLKSILMQKSDEKNANAQERDAYAHPEYLKHLERYRDAVIADELMRARRVAAEMKIEVWRTEQANYRSMKI